MTPKSLSVDSVMLLCIGNICRSPMAEALLRHRCPGLRVSSAGLAALIGRPADALACEVASAHGLDLSGHVARPIQPDALAASELVLTMSEAQTRELLRRYPFMRGRVYRVGHWTDQDVADPYMRPRAAFEEAFEVIEAGLDSWLKHLV